MYAFIYYEQLGERSQSLCRLEKRERLRSKEEQERVGAEVRYFQLHSPICFSAHPYYMLVPTPITYGPPPKIGSGRRNKIRHDLPLGLGLILALLAHKMSQLSQYSFLF